MAGGPQLLYVILAIASHYDVCLSAENVVRESSCRFPKVGCFCGVVARRYLQFGPAVVLKIDDSPYRFKTAILFF